MTIEIILFTIFLTIINFITGFKKSSLFGCGLVGFSSKNPVNLPAINFLMWHNAETRGKHATGLFTPNTGVLKKSGEAINFIKDQSVQNNIKLDNTLIAHVRKATVGDIYSVNNAHPFDVGNLVVQHNGTLDNYKELAEKYKLDPNSWKTDSQVLAQCLEKNHNAKEGFKVLEEYKGAAAFIIYNKEADVLYVGHDKERPLFYGFINEDMYISSIELSLQIIGCRNIVSFPECVIHTIKEGKIIHTKNYIKKADKSVMKTLVASLSDILTFSKNGLNSVFFKEDNKFTGLPHGAPADWLVNYWIKPSHDIKFSANSEMAIVNKSKYYRIEEIIDRQSFYVTDDNNIKGKAYKANFDLHYFIPIKGNRVTMLNVDAYDNLTLNKSYEVIYHRFNDDFVVIKDNEGKNLAVGIIDCRVSTAEEWENEHLAVTVETTEQVKDNIVNFTIVTEESEQQSLFTDEDLEDEIPSELDLLQEGVDNLITTIADEFSKMVDNPNFSADENTTNTLIKLDAFMGECCDYNFLINLNSNSYKNFEVKKINEIC